MRKARLLSMLALLQMAVTGATAQTTNTAIFVAGNTNTIQGEGRQGRLLSGH